MPWNRSICAICGYGSYLCCKKDIEPGAQFAEAIHDLIYMWGNWPARRICIRIIHNNLLHFCLARHSEALLSGEPGIAQDFVSRNAAL